MTDRDDKAGPAGGTAGADHEIAPFNIGDWRGHIVSDFADTDLVKLFSGPEFPSPEFPGHVDVVASNIGGTYRLSLPGPEGRSFYAKYFSSRPLAEAIKGVFTLTEGARSWKAAWIMKEEGVPTPRPVALMERKVAGIRRRSVFITEAVDHAHGENLEMYFRENFDRAPLTGGLVQEKREIIRLIGEMFRTAHGQDRIYFPDFHPHNMVFQKTPEGRMSLFLVDFDEVRFKVRKDDPMKNLSSIGRNAVKVQNRMQRGKITGTDKMRFIKAYLGPGNDGPEETSALCQDILDNWNLK